MKDDFNVLVTSISKKIPLLKKVKEELLLFGHNNKLYGADSQQECIGRYFVDEFWNMPSLELLTLNQIIDYCKKHEIRGIIPTRDGELLFFSKIKQNLLEHQISVMVSDEAILKTCLDKKLFYQFMQQNEFLTPKTSLDLSELEGKRFVVKERFGAGSKGIGINLTRKQALVKAKKLKEPLFQPFIKGSEYTVDLYIEKKGTVKGIMARKRLLIVDGESQISETEKIIELEDLSIKIALKLGLTGHVLFQAIQQKENNQVNHCIIECNARFGGASTLSVEAGLTSFRWFFEETLNQPLTPFKRLSNEIKLVRHAKDTYFSL